ncbi:Serine/threonine-protein kinase pim-3 [Triplophysa tibetana]|uniref:non-specific serine/threonine protein kinase n=1 Tax=Triplophysa tibetana TaxID=1572043 RepID=A0A5A9N7W9_9TELE|nr:Serine/threonine-protein kinase pim-3 [Triplophysa tibetana]
MGQTFDKCVKADEAIDASEVYQLPARAIDNAIEKDGGGKKEKKKTSFPRWIKGRKGPAEREEPVTQTPPETADRSRNDVINRLLYKIGKKLCDGAVGSIYKARHIRTRRKPGYAKPIPREIALLILANDGDNVPEIVQLLEWQDFEKHYVMVLDIFPHCKNLSDFLLDAGNQITEMTAKSIMRQATKAAYTCYKRGVFHRDIKLENFLINTDTLEIKLINFECGDLYKNTAYRDFIGTEDYFCPEYFKTGKYNARTAMVYSLGVLLFTLLCRRFPDSNDKNQMKNKIWSLHGFSKECCSLIEACLHENPKERILLEKIHNHAWIQDEHQTDHQQNIIQNPANNESVNRLLKEEIPIPLATDSPRTRKRVTFMLPTDSRESGGEIPLPLATDSPRTRKRVTFMLPTDSRAPGGEIPLPLAKDSRAPRGEIPLPLATDSPRTRKRVKLKLPTDSRAPGGEIPLPPATDSPRTSKRVTFMLPTDSRAPGGEIPLPLAIDSRAPRGEIPLPLATDSPRTRKRVKLKLPTDSRAPRGEIPLPLASDSPRTRKRVKLKLPTDSRESGGEIPLPLAIDSPRTRKRVTFMLPTDSRAPRGEIPPSLATGSQSKGKMEDEKQKNLLSKKNYYRLYKIGKKLCDGAVGSIYKARHIRTRRKVAVKYVDKNNTDYIIIPGYAKPIPREIALLILANDGDNVPEIVQLLEWQDFEKHYVMVLDIFPPCKNLSDFFLDAGNQITEMTAKSIMWQATKAAYTCYKRGVFHRDIKLENFLINTDTLEIKLINFECGDLYKKTAYRDFIGTEDYFCPEYFKTSKYHAKSATVYSLGVLLFTLLCRRFPDSNDKNQMKNKIWSLHGFSKECCSLIEACLHENPKERILLEKIHGHAWIQDEHQTDHQQNIIQDPANNESVNRLLKEEIPLPLAKDSMKTRKRVTLKLPTDSRESRGEIPLPLATDSPRTRKRVTLMPPTDSQLSEGEIPLAFLTDSQLSEGEIPLAFLTDSQLSEGEIPLAFLTDSQLSEGEIPLAFLTDSHLSEGEIPLAFLTDSHLSEGEIPLAFLTDRHLSEGEIPLAFLTDRHLSEGEIPLAFLTDSQLSEGEIPLAF